MYYTDLVIPSFPEVMSEYDSEAKPTYIKKNLDDEFYYWKKD